MISPFRASFARLVAILVKEFIQIRRDRLTFAMMFGIPILQLTLFGYAINADPKNLPTAIRIADQSPFARSLVRALENSGYFRIVRATASEAEADRLLEAGKVQFVLHVPTDFGRELMRGEGCCSRSTPLIRWRPATRCPRSPRSIAARSTTI